MGYSLSVQPESSSAGQVDLATQSDGKLLATCGTSGGFDLFRLNSGPLDQRLYAAQDTNHNVTVLIDTAGHVVERYHYLPYGQRFVYDANWTAITDAYGLLVGFQGGWRDPATGLYLFNIGGDGREYTPTLGRWLQKDKNPKGTYADGMSSYVFVHSSPTGNVDPNGMETYADCVERFNRRVKEIQAKYLPQLGATGAMGGGLDLVGGIFAGLAAGWQWGKFPGAIVGCAVGAAGMTATATDINAIWSQYQAELQSARDAFNRCYDKATAY